MRRYRTIEIIEHPSYLLRESAIFASQTLPFPFPTFAHDDLDFSYALDFINPRSVCYESITDLIQLDTTLAQYKKKSHHHQVSSSTTGTKNGAGSDLYLQKLCDRVSALELSYDRLVEKKLKKVDRKYTWTAEIKGSGERKYGFTVEIDHQKKKKKKKNEEEEEEVKKKVEKKKKEGSDVKSCRWTAEIKRKGEEGVPIVRKYIYKSGDWDGSESSGSEKEKKKKKKGDKKDKDTRFVEIEEVADHGGLVLRRAFAKRDNGKGKKKELSPLDAANLIQMRFRAYLIRRSQVLRGLRELAIAKTKLKELRELFHNFAYRRHVDRDAEERQRFTEKIIVLLLTIDAIEGVDLMVRSAKRSMTEELETMLEVVDPQPVSKSLSMRRRTFDMPSGGIQKGIAAGVNEVVQMLYQEENGCTVEV